MRRSGIVSMLLVLTVSQSGCSKELLAGGQRGDVGAAVTDDGSAPSPRGSLAAPVRASRSAAAPSAPQGQVATSAVVDLVAEGGETVRVAAGSGVVAIGASELAVLGRDSVPAVVYTRARVTFTRVAADVVAGLSVGGVNITGQVTVALPGEVVVERPINMVVLPGSSRTVVVDLNAATWLQSLNPLSRTVAAADFQAAVEVRTR